MEQHELDYLTRIAPQLVKLINLNTTLILVLRANNILSDDDIADLKAISNELEKKSRFLEIIQMKPGAYNQLIKVLKGKQDGAVNLLEKIPQKDSQSGPSNTAASSVQTVQQCTMQQGSGRQRYSLNFGNHDILNTVMPKVRADLVAKMNSEEANTMMLTEVAALNYFDHSEIESLITGSYSSERKRMLEFFAKLANLDELEILDCFEKLCNLDGQPKAAERFRNVFKKHFPDCL